MTVEVAMPLVASIKVAPPAEGGFLAPWRRRIEELYGAGVPEPMIARLIEPDADLYYKERGENGAEVDAKDIEFALWHLWGGLPPPEGRHGPLQRFVGQILKLHDEGKGLAEIADWIAWYRRRAEPYRHSEGWYEGMRPMLTDVRWVLQQAGRLPPQKIPPPKRARDWKAFELRQAGWALRRIGEEVGLSPERVRQVCDRVARYERWQLPPDNELYFATLDAVERQLAEARAAERGRLLARPLDMGGPRDEWIEATAWDAR
jgi:hypothetical protein